MYIAYNHNFFKQIKKISFSDLNINLIKYGYCSKQSYGFIKDLIRNNSINLIPDIINYSTAPSNKWIFYENKIFESDPKKIIILNYGPLFYGLVKKSKNKYEIPSNRINQGIEFIEFVNQEKLPKKIEIQIEKDNFRRKKIIYRKVLQLKNFNKESVRVYLNYKTNLMQDRESRFYLKIKNNKDNEINQINLKYLDFLNINNYKILEKKENCYLVKKIND